MLSLLISVILCVPLVLFALSNTATVRFALWPTDYGVDAPISIAMLSAMAISFLLGALLVWASALSQKRRARRAERTVRVLEDHIEDLKTRVGSATSRTPVV
jgi:uncharacterized integral membrane protein